MIHDQELIDQLENLPVSAWQGVLYRVAWSGSDPLAGSVAGGRWSPKDQFEVLYTSLDLNGAVAEIDFRLSLEPIRPTKPLEVHTIRVQAAKTLMVATLSDLDGLGVDMVVSDS